MQQKPCKIKSYIGFAIKSRSIKFGVDDILKSKKCEIILYDQVLAKSSKDKLLNFASIKKIDAIIIQTTLMQELFGENLNIKAVAITDKNLALAIKKNMTNN